MDINNLKISDMLQLSYELWEKNKDSWSPMDSQYAKTSILYMIEEVGEAIAIIKKKGEDKIMNDEDVRNHFIEEMGDTLMYFMDTLNRFNVSAEEFSKIYSMKYDKNMKRDYEKEYEILK